MNWLRHFFQLPWQMKGFILTILLFAAMLLLSTLYAYYFLTAHRNTPDTPVEKCNL
jgi:hypothetical protein